MTGRDLHNLMRPAPVTVGVLVLRSLVWSAIASGCAAAVAAVIAIVVSLDQVDVARAFVMGAWVGALAFVPLFLGRLICLSRNLADWSFAWAGLLATFFGLAMLAVFFWQLSVEAIAWFEVSPRLIEQKNHELKETAKRYIEKEKEQLYREMERDIGREEVKLKVRFANLEPAALAKKLEEARLEIRQEYDETVLPDRMPIWEKNAQERQIEAEKSIRADTGPGALLTNFVAQGPSHVGQDAGIFPALLGSLWIAVITICLAVPIGVGAALYLEEYKHAGWLGQIIQVNINNLAGVPSVVYGILGAFVFVEMIFKPMESNQAAVLASLAANPESLTIWDRFLAWLPAIAARNVLGGGMTLALLTLPVVIVSAQEAIRAVPPSIRQGAYALGATQWQVIWHQVLPLARPGIMTGTILAVARAIGEAAPLILFGALLLVQQNPSLFSRFTVMPMQIFGWADRPAVVVPVPYEQQVQFLSEHAARTVGLAGNPAAVSPLAASASAAISGQVPTEAIDIWHYNAAMASILLLIVLLGLNAIAIVLRNRAQRKLHW